MSVPPQLTVLPQVGLASELRELDAKIAPMQVSQGGQLFWVTGHDLFGTAFNFVEPDDLAPVTQSLLVIGSLITNHTFAYQGLVKPTAAEVLMQLPESLLEVAVGYSLDPNRSAEIHRGENPACPECREWHRVPLLIYGPDGTEPGSARAKPETAAEILYLLP